MALRLKRGEGESGGVDPRALAQAGTLGAGLLLMAALLVIVNYFGWKYHHRADWTASQLYTLSEKTENVLAGLDRDVEAVALLPPGDELAGPTREVLARYESASPRFSVRWLDAERNPLEAQRLVEEYGLTSPSLVIASGEERRVIQRDDLAEFDFSAMQFGGPPEMGAFKGEQLITGALIELSEERRPKVRFTTGHGEIRLDDVSAGGLGALAQLLREDNFEVEEWATLGQAAVPADTDLLVVAGPTSTFVPPEVAMFDRFLADGGRMLVLLDPVPAPAGAGELLATGLEPWLAEWGIEVGNDVVVDPANPLPFFGSETMFVTDYGGHPITRSVADGGLPVIFSLARSVEAGGVPDGYRSTVLARTSSEGWGETDVSSAEVEQGEGDLAGPVPLGVVVEAEDAADEGTADEVADDFETLGLEDGEEAEAETDDAAEDGAGAALPGLAEPARRGPTRLVVLGDSNFASDQLLQASQANVVLLIDTLNWLAERESLLGIPPKKPERVRLSLTGGQMAWLYGLALLILPGLSVILGVVVWLRRRR